MKDVKKKSYKNVLYIKFIEGFNFFFVNLLFLKWNSIYIIREDDVKKM